jgi:ABC-type polysaccharide/polyol phosphate transport system ATPase subunit
MRCTIETNGSRAPILELGIGFHGDLTAKENALVHGVIMSLPRSAVRKLLMMRRSQSATWSSKRNA